MKGEGDDSPNNLSRSEEDTSEISLEIKSTSTFTKLKPVKKQKKIEENIFSKNLSQITLPQKNLKYYTEGNSYYKYVGKSIFVFMN